MIYLILGLIALGIIAAIIGYFRNKKLQQMVNDGELSEMPEPKELQSSCNSCGINELCERDEMMSASCQTIEYYNDEELDNYKGIASDAYDEKAVDEFREVLYTLRQNEVAGWLHSLQLREVNLPDSLKDEAFMLVSDKQQ